MSNTKATRTWIATFMAMCLLFGQIATAAYACPQLLNNPAPIATDAMITMMDCDSMESVQMDAAQPNLCKAHCQVGQLSHDPKSVADATTLAVAVLWSMVWILPPVLESTRHNVAISHAPDRPAGSYPIYLVNQVFRL